MRAAAEAHLPRRRVAGAACCSAHCHTAAGAPHSQARLPGSRRTGTFKGPSAPQACMRGSKAECLTGGRDSSASAKDQRGRRPHLRQLLPVSCVGGALHLHPCLVQVEERAQHGRMEALQPRHRGSRRSGRRRPVWRRVAAPPAGAAGVCARLCPLACGTAEPPAIGTSSRTGAREATAAEGGGLGALVPPNALLMALIIAGASAEKIGSVQLRTLSCSACPVASMGQRGYIAALWLPLSHQ